MRKVAIVTGANRGIGFEIVRELAKLEKFDFVYLTGRNEEAGRTAVAKIGNPRVKFFRLDLTEMQTIVDFRNYLAENSEEISVLILNAAMGGNRGINAKEVIFIAFKIKKYI